ncbi:alpha/beta hydrolase [Lapillicoccus jejuensis]|uniref:Enterochelin esterase-like enzyme n=1 Tax=Lapillicoccus jejuensis TaxID=402171 RepID=A0A542E5Q8_9MICO|nr:alpha/beta hydrolase-fold protein [Lapillicoccus jejuensis]TQJ10668.1 enterochelin esterase-like enzyme [Lapillicoccus jejuensis]
MGPLAIDSPLVLGLAVALAVVGLLAAALLSSRTRRTLRGFTARLGLHLLVAALVLLVAGVALNDQYGFYASWSDLLGRSGAVDQAAAGAAPGQALRDPVPGATPSGTPTTVDLRRPALPDPGRRRQLFTVHGAASGLTGRVAVLLPADYEQPATAGRSYPVVYALAGYPATPTTWFDSTSMPAIVDGLTASGTLARAVIASPQLEIPTGRDTECVDGGHGRPAVETFLAQDVPSFLEAHLRLRTDRASWTTLGYSMGGWCAAVLTMRHPSTFGSALVLGGYFQPLFDPSYAPFAPSSAAAAGYDLEALAATRPPPVAMWVFTSRSDGTSYPTTRRFLAAARAPLSVTSVVQGDSGHRMSVWLDALPTALAWLAATVPGWAGGGSPSPTAGPTSS